MQVSFIISIIKIGIKSEPLVSCSWFPPGLEIRENLEKWDQSGKSQGILSRLEKSGNFTQNTGKVGKIVLEN